MKQAPTPLRNLVPEEDRKKFDEAYHCEATAYVLEAVVGYMQRAIDGELANSDDRKTYDSPAWPYLQADSAGFRRAYRNLMKILNI